MTPSTPPPPASPPAGPAASAVADLARRLGVDSGGIRVVDVEAVTWSDSSLGCPQPGMMYAQVLVEGVRIVLEASGRRYEYHAGGNRPPFLCENPRPPSGR